MVRDGPILSVIVAHKWHVYELWNKILSFKNMRQNILSGTPEWPCFFGITGVKGESVINNICRHMLIWITKLRERDRGLDFVSSY